MTQPQSSLFDPPSDAPVMPAGGDSFRQGVIACIPTVLGYLSIGLSAGALGRLSGLSVAEVTLLSLLLYAGSGQFIFANMVAAGASGLSIVTSIFFVNLRHLLLSSYLAPYFRHNSFLKNLLLGSQLTDETFAVAAALPEEQRRRGIDFAWMWGLNLTAYVNWVLGNLLGAVAAEMIPTRFVAGLQFALVAMFIGLIVLQFQASARRHIDALAALTAGLLVIPLALWLGKDYSIILAAVIGATLGLGVMRWTSARTSR